MAASLQVLEPGAAGFDNHRSFSLASQASLAAPKASCTPLLLVRSRAPCRSARCFHFLIAVIHVLEKRSGRRLLSQTAALAWRAEGKPSCVLRIPRESVLVMWMWCRALKAAA